jgi:lipoprotein-releasing system ATP-binding protein
MEALLKAESLKKSFFQGGRELEVLHCVDLSIGRGERVALLGPSGAGKSTLLHILGTLERPTAGRVVFEDEDVFSKDDEGLAHFRNQRVGFVFQFHHLLAEFTALENAAMPAMISGLSREESFAKARKLLEEVGLDHRLGHRPTELSGGEQQRVALARALVCEPKILLADEPTGNLDAQTGEEVHQLLTDLNRSKGVTLLVVTHNLELAERMDRVITLQDGRIVQDENK